MTARRLLVIDDDKNVTTIVTQVASDMGFDVRSSCGQEILKTLNAFKPEIITLDILMPEIDGFEILSILQRQRSKARVMIMSGGLYRNIADNLGTAFNITMDGSISKPFKLQELRQALENSRNALAAEEKVLPPRFAYEVKQAS